MVDIKYHEASDSFYLLGNVNDYDATGILQSKYHGIIRFDENIQNTTFHHTFKNYLVSSGNFGAGAHAWCKKLDIDRYGNVYCAGITNLEVGIDAEKGVEETDESVTLSDNDIFYAKLHYLGFLEWVRQLDTTYENDKDFASDSTGDQYFEDILIRGQDDILIMARTKSNIEDIILDGELLSIIL